MTIKDYLAVIRQRFVLVGLVVIITTSSAVLFGLRQTPEYSADSRLLVVPLPLLGSGEELSSKYGFQRGIKTEAEILKSTEVAQRVIAQLGLDRAPYIFTAKKLVEDHIQILMVDSTEVLEITAVAPDPELAAALANAFPEQYINLRREEAVRQAKEGSEEIAKEMTRLLDKLNEIDVMLQKSDAESSRGRLLSRQRDEVVGSMASLEVTRQKLIDESPLKNRGVGRILEPATASKGRSNSDLARTAVLGLVIGLPLAFGLALLLDSMSDTIRTKEEAERIVGIETLGVIPLSPEWRSNKAHIVSKEAPYSAAAEAYRTLRINLDSRGPASEARRYLITSPGAGEGKTTTSANLGVAFAEAGRSALVVSADLRRPRLHHMFGIDVGPGLAELITGEASSEEVVKEPSPYLYVVASGSAGERPDQLLTRGDVKGTLDEITVARVPSRRKPRNDENGTAGMVKADGPKPAIYAQPNVTLVDAPAVLGAAEVSALAHSVDGVILVLQAGVTRREAAARAAEQITRSGGKLVGVVLVGVKEDIDYSMYPPLDGSDDVSNSTWSKVVSSLKS